MHLYRSRGEYRMLPYFMDIRKSHAMGVLLISVMVRCFGSGWAVRWVVTDISSQPANTM